LNHLEVLGLDTQKAQKTALKLHAHSVLYAHKLTATGRALEESSSQGLGWSGAGEGLSPSKPSKDVWLSDTTLLLL